MSTSYERNAIVSSNEKLDDWWIAGNWPKRSLEDDNRVYRRWRRICSPFAKCRSAVIYLSTIDTSPEVNGRVVTIGSWTTVRMGRLGTDEATTCANRHCVRPQQHQVLHYGFA